MGGLCGIDPFASHHLQWNPAAIEKAVLVGAAARADGVSQAPAIGFDRVLEVCSGIPEMKVKGWGDVNRVDVRPSKGMLKVWAKSNWEAQIDISTGEVLQVAYRRSDLIESIHDGSWLHDAVKLWIFLPAGVTLLLLWLTGMYLFVLPYVVKRRRR